MNVTGPETASASPHWPWIVAQVVVWALLFLAMAVARQLLEAWLLSRFQRRDAERITASMLWGTWFARPSVAHFISLLAGLLAGAAIPLLPQFQIQGWSVSLSPLSSLSVGVLYVLAMDWCSIGLLAGATPGYPPQRNAVNRNAISAQLLAALPVVLIVLSLVVTTGMLQPWHAGTLNLSTISGLQGSWAGMRWLAILQPLACVLWMVCAAPRAPDPSLRATLAWQIHALNRVLLTTALLAGGWEGPLVGRFPALGLLYTAAKGALITFVWVWVSASRPLTGMASGSLSTWRLCTSLAGLNLLITALLATAQAPLSGLGLP